MIIANLGSSLYVIITGVLCFCLGYIFRKTFIKTKAKSNIFIYIFLSVFYETFIGLFLYGVIQQKSRKVKVFYENKKDDMFVYHII